MILPFWQADSVEFKRRSLYNSVWRLKPIPSYPNEIFEHHPAKAVTGFYVGTVESDYNPLVYTVVQLGNTVL